MQPCTQQDGRKNSVELLKTLIALAYMVLVEEVFMAFKCVHGFPGAQAAMANERILGERVWKM